MKLHAYLDVEGQCAEAFHHYAKLLGGQLEITTHGEAPAGAPAR